MHGADGYIAAVVALLFVAGLIVILRALRERLANHRDWDGAMIGVRAVENVRNSTANKRA